jgi:two-component system, OmpR family, phosphate regulon sensor histidine kinase PhoR
MFWPLLAFLFLVGAFAIHCAWRVKFSRAIKVKERQLAELRDAQRDALIKFQSQEYALKQLENTRREFVANVSHELRTPLSMIKGYVETLLEGAKDNPEVAGKFLQTIEKHTDRLTYLIEDLLTISQLESNQIVLNCGSHELRPLVAKVIEDLTSRAAERNILLNNEVPPDLRAEVDVDRLEQVFWNLIDNSIKYGKAGGNVVIGGRRRDSAIEMWVKDDGPGIPEESLGRIFERFYRVDKARSREQGGTGLGLAIVKHVVQCHGGDVWVESKLGRGTTFNFTLPLGPE